VRVLIACEFSGIVREAFRERGHFAMSCDLLDTEIPGNHYKGDIKDVLNDGWDLMIAHPPCTDLAVSGAKHWRQRDEEGALDFVAELLECSILKIALENPVGLISTYIRKPDQIVHPYYFGDPYQKRTCLWLKDLPLLKPTNLLTNYSRSTIHRGLAHKESKGTFRSRFWPGMAKAMAQQWG
jgi:hypothetical protein